MQLTILNGCLAHRRDWISSIQLSYINSILNVLTVFQNLKNATLLSETSTIYELITNREDNFKQHQILYQKLSEMIHDTL